jgi:hypothetical protein
MKKITLLSIIILSLFLSSAKAQDLIVKIDGTIIKAKITEVTDELIKYKKADNPDGPIYSASKSTLRAINYENGTVEKFEASPKVTKKNDEDEDEDSEAEEKPKKNPILEDAPLKRTIEGIAKDVGEQLLRSCSNGKVDNSTTSIYWDGVYKDAITGEINVPIITTWKPKWSESDSKWIKGKIVISADGKKKWIYQNDNGLLFSGCGKEFKIKQN